MKYEHKSKLEDCIYVEDNAISKMLCYDLIKHFEDSISFRTDDHRKQADEMQLVGDPRKESIEFKGPKHHKKYLAVILYLNDCDDGETVFPVAGAEIQPEMGRIAIWPSGLPFYHYGKKSSTVKYIITTWFEFE